jgi:hypothetical protein
LGVQFKGKISQRACLDKDLGLVCGAVKAELSGIARLPPDSLYRGLIPVITDDQTASPPKEVGEA